MERKHVAIVGAGPGGLATAMLLSSQGYRVSLFEKQPYLGGRTSRLQLGRYSFDRGATFLMMPSLLEELFRLADRDVNDYARLTRLDPLYELRFGDQAFAPSTDRDRTFEEIERLFPGDGTGYLRFMRDEGLKFDRVAPLLRRPFERLADYARGDVFAALPRLHATDTVYGRLSRYFRDERLRNSFSFQAKYLGMSPWECPGTFTILSYMEHRYGLYHPEGGVNRICEAMAEVAREYGAAVHASAGVTRVLTERGKAVGVQLESGEKIAADHVVLNADFATAMTTLFEEGTLRKYTPERLARKKYSCSAYMLYLGVRRKLNMPHHTILFAEDYRRNVTEMIGERRLSEDPSIYVHNPSACDPTLAPEGHSALYVLMPVPNTTGQPDWNVERERVRAQILARLEREPELRGISSDIEVEHCVTPVDWRDRYGVYNGATFNLSHSLDQMMHLRPHNRFEELANCWLVGGGTHPGSGLPTILESAKISSSLIARQDRGERSGAVSLSVNAASGADRKGARPWISR